MFETEIVLWLQSFASDWVTLVMVSISEAGYTRFYLLLAIGITFGFDFRLGFVLFQMVLWSSALTGLLKDLVALPRPAEVDSAVQLLGQDTANPTAFRGEDGDHFLDLPEPEVIDHYRALPEVAYGLPSGHVSTATAFWFGWAKLRKSRILSTFAIIFVLAMGLSRMYLGRHFLADVLGGFVLGLFVVMALRWVLRPARVHHLFPLRPDVTGFRPSHIWMAAGLAVAPLLLLVFESNIDFRSTGRLIGANAAFAFLAIRGMPAGCGGGIGRVMRIALAVALYAIGSWAVGWLEVAGFEGESWAEFVSGSLPPLLFLVGTVEIGSRLGLFESVTVVPTTLAESS